jgi:hypothetical protein
VVKEQRKERAIRATYLFDTFCRMTAPTEIDVTQHDGIPASAYSGRSLSQEELRHFASDKRPEPAPRVAALLSAIRRISVSN